MIIKDIAGHNLYCDNCLEEATLFIEFGVNEKGVQTIPIIIEPRDVILCDKCFDNLKNLSKSKGSNSKR